MHLHSTVLCTRLAFNAWLPASTKSYQKDCKTNLQQFTDKQETECNFATGTRANTLLVVTFLQIRLKLSRPTATRICKFNIVDEILPYCTMTLQHLHSPTQVSVGSVIILIVPLRFFKLCMMLYHAVHPNDSQYEYPPRTIMLIRDMLYQVHHSEPLQSS